LSIAEFVTAPDTLYSVTLQFKLPRCLIQGGIACKHEHVSLRLPQLAHFEQIFISTLLSGLDVGAVDADQ